MTSDRHARAKQVFLAACEASGDSRREIVARECRDDEELRHEVESLLAHHDTQTIIAGGRSQPTEERARPGTSAAPPAGRRLAPRVWRLDKRGYAAFGSSVAALLILAIGFWSHAEMRESLRNLTADKLEQIVDGKQAGLRLWLGLERDRIEGWSRDPDLREHIRELSTLAAAAPQPSAALAASSHQAEVRQELRAIFGANARYAIWDRTYKTIADWSADGTGLGEGVTPDGMAVLSRVFDGETVVRLPDKRSPITRNYPVDAARSHVEFLVPIRDDGGRALAALLVYEVGAAERMNKMLAAVRLGKSGESYAFNEQGLMISESRFDEQLQELGLIPRNARSSLAVEVRDPGGDLTQGYVPRIPRPACPLTEMARFAIAGHDGVDVDGYRDYRGVKVVGAWRWLKELDIGVATEIDFDEAYASLGNLRLLLAALCGVLLLSVGGTIVSFISIKRLRRQLGASKRVGPYTLESVIGEGGMGVVYRARHDLLRRPTAVKLLKPERANATTLAWFEREVQLASQLQHPNTIEIYDFGIAESGDFYYAMEYLSGLTLAQLVDMEGAIPPARAIGILKQMCGSLREAHGLRLVHRDVKPQNIMLCNLGGAADFVKVLDFGLAKSSDPPVAGQSTASLAGTPLYMAPERFRESGVNDPRSDLYSLGAVGYKLLTGQDVFTSVSMGTLLQEILDIPAARPSSRGPQAIPADLDQLIVDCLAKDPAQRPSTADAVLARLDAIVCDVPWEQEQARQWWTIHADLKA